jgi:hypothetical protein
MAISVEFKCLLNYRFNKQIETMCFSHPLKPLLVREMEREETDARVRSEVVKHKPQGYIEVVGSPVKTPSPPTGTTSKFIRDLDS